MPTYFKDYDAIKTGLEKVVAIIEEMKNCANTLENNANEAETLLLDEKAKKNINAIKEIASAIKKATAQGEDRVRELKHKVVNEENAFNELGR